MRKPNPDHRGLTVTIALLLTVSLYTVSCAAKKNTVDTESPLEEEVDEVAYKKVDPPSEAPVFRWDFSKPNVVHQYAYEQVGRSKADMLSSFVSKPGGMEQEMSAKGLLLIKSQGDSTAILVLKNLKMSMGMDINESESKTMEQQMPPIVVQGMKEDGSCPFGNSDQELFLKMLFPLPEKALKVGESVDMPAQMLFNAMGSVLQVTGRSRITLTRYVEIDDSICAELNVDTDISKLDVPTEMIGEYKASAKGTSVFYFDISNRAFVSGTTDMILQFSVDAPMPQIKIQGEDTSGIPKRIEMSMAMDSLISVKLKE